MRTRTSPEAKATPGAKFALGICHPELDTGSTSYSLKNAAIKAGYRVARKEDRPGI
jgi:hypothetical protein